MIEAYVMPTPLILVCLFCFVVVVGDILGLLGIALQLAGQWAWYKLIDRRERKRYAAKG